MRLTLRTMLAYMDNVLEPSDAEVLGKKIEESDFAQGLVQRIRTVLKKVRMNAPKLDGKGMGNDANTVAEYLDSALPQDRVGDFERVCLESDAHLAEVAGCHQVLTIVLGKPADVPAELRERVYSLAGAGAVTPPPVAPPRHEPTAPPKPANGQPVMVAHTAEVPDYLRSGSRVNPWVVLAAIAGVLLLSAVGLRAMGPFDSRHPLLGSLFAEPRVASNTAGTAAQTNPADPPKSSNEQGTEETTPATSTDANATTVLDSATAPGDTKAAAEINNSKASVDVPPATDPPPPTEPSPTEPSEPAATEDGKAAPIAQAPAADAPRAVPGAVKPPIATAPAAVRTEVGRFISDEQVLARLAPNDDVWMRVPPRSVLSSGERLIALPAFRAQIALASGVQITFAGESSVELHPADAAGASRIAVGYGRMHIVTVGAAGSRLAVDLAGIQGVITLVDADSALAINVQQWLPPGLDPEANAAIPVVELFNTHGRIAWEETGKERVDIPPQHVRVYVAAEPPETQGPFLPPDWIDAKSVTPIDRDSAQILQDALDFEKPLTLALMEKMQDRRVNVRALASRCLGFLDEFEPLLKELSDGRQYSFWTGEFHALRHAIMRSPETAAHLRASIERLRWPDAKTLYRLLWAYSPEQLEKDGASQLVKLLEHEEMDIRVLTFQNLLSITGVQEFYRPEKRPDQNRGAIQNWKERLAKGTIAYRSEPSPLEPYKPLDRPPAAAVEISAPRGAVAPLE